MSDGIRMMDLAVLSRPLDELRRVDPEQKVLAERLAARATVRHLERIHEDVASTEATSETRVDDHPGKGGRRGSEGGNPRHQEPQEDEPGSVPERQEGLVLDIKA